MFTIWIPVVWGSIFSTLLITRLKKVGEMGSSCLTPLDGCSRRLAPLISNVVSCLLFPFMMYLRILGSMPASSAAFARVLWVTLSKAFTSMTASLSPSVFASLMMLFRLTSCNPSVLCCRPGSQVVQPITCGTPWPAHLRL